MYRFLEYTLLAAIVVILQVFLLNNLYVGIYVSPFIYTAFIILLPMEIRGYVLLLLAAGMGALMDVFMGTPAINTIATVFMAFCRPAVIRLFVTKDVIIDGGTPNIKKLGVSKFVNYALVLIVLHATVFYIFENMAFSAFWANLLRFSVGVASTLGVVYLCQLLFIVNRSKI